MTQASPPAARARHRGNRQVGIDELQLMHLWASVLPAAVVTLLAAAAVLVALVANPAAPLTAVVLAGLGAAALGVLVAAARRAGTTSRWVYQRLDDLRSLHERGRDDLRALTEQLRRGERPAAPGAEPAAQAEGDPFAQFAGEIRLGQHEVHDSLVQVANSLPAVSGSDQRVEVFVNLARRMQSLVHREIQLLDDLEAQVEDPDLLKGLFTVDHLATRMRRQSESLAVLGGATSRRQWTRPVGLHEVLRAAVAEVEQYSRVKVVPPVEGTLGGGAVADVIHLVAELIENATKFSAPHTQVLLRAQHVTSGLAIEVEDRGLGMVPADQQRVNELLDDPGRVNLNALLRDGRIGLFVVSTLARRHGIRVQLQTNIYGGTQAVVVLPKRLVDDAGVTTSEHRPATVQARREPEPAMAAAAPVGHASASEETTRIRAASVALQGEGSWTGNGAGGGRHALGAHHVDGRDGVVTGAADEHRPALPVREPDGWRAEWEVGPQYAPQPPQPALPAAPVPATATAPPPASAPLGGPQLRPAEPGERPPLPQREVQSHLAPQLREAPSGRSDDPADDYDPGLMAAFRGGVNRAEEEVDDGTDDRR